MSKQHYTDEDYKQLHQAHCHTESLREGLAKALVASENENARLRMVIRDVLSGNAKLRIERAFQNALVLGFENDARCEEILKQPLNRVNAEIDAIFAQLRGAMNVGASDVGNISEIDPVCVDTFVLHMRRIVERFKREWNGNVEAFGSDNYPPEMTLNQWLNQFDAWYELPEGA